MVPTDPNVGSSEPVKPAAAFGGQLAAMDKNTTNGQIGTKRLVQNPVVERRGGASCQLDENQLQFMEALLNQNVTTLDTKQRTENTTDDKQC